MAIRIDAQQLAQFDKDLAKAGRAFDYNVTATILRKSGKPMLAAAMTLVPIGSTFRYERGRNSGDSSVGGTYDRGGATRRDLRLKVVSDAQGNAVLLVGVNKNRGHVGWRTHLITRANKNRRTPNDFLGKAESQTIDIVINSFGTDAQEVIRRILKRAAR
ncbi:hypothetical protein IC229_33700 [Spirosoma sp. BT702]|uniref:Uncharacterized protein n=1 Tax=Spirosoma profusum TaxID=2771354 RepID=A0A927AWD4_9BACT|nr:hypothetical protein [Spirosoma profusum]MBD2705612.1 hypothetical protein [Spirosoma profusum]